MRHYKLWQDGNKAKELQSNAFLEQKLEYIHMNPIRAEWVNEPEYYSYSSACNYASELSMLEIKLLE